MRGKDFNTGLRGVLFEFRHYGRMGSAIWLYGWLVLRQTHQSGSTGFVLGGAPISYQEIEEETGFNGRTLERWMSTLRREGYIETEPVMGGLTVRITKAKKHAHPARTFTGAGADALRRAAKGIRKFADGPRNSAEGCTQNCGAGCRNCIANTHVAEPIRSSSVEESLEKSQAQQQIRNLNPSQSVERQNQIPEARPAKQRGPFSEPERRPRVRVEAPQQPWLALAETRLQLELLRAEREEAVRRELCVGRGPEIVPRKQALPAEPEVKRP